MCFMTKYISFAVKINNSEGVQVYRGQEIIYIVLCGIVLKWTNKNREMDIKHKLADQEPSSMTFFGVELQCFSKTSQFFILSLGIFFFAVLHGIAMEKIFRYPGNSYFSRQSNHTICKIFFIFSYYVYKISAKLDWFIPTFVPLLELKPHGWYLTLIQFGSYAIISKVDLTLRGQNTWQIPLNIYGILALVLLVTIGFSNAR